MSLTLIPKPPLPMFIETCTPLAIIDSLEKEISNRVATITNALLGYSSDEDPATNLTRFLKADKDFLGIVLALTNLSQEKFLRILSAERFSHGDYGLEWNSDVVHRKIRNEEGFAEKLALLFLDGRNNPLLAQLVAPFYLEQLSLAENWDTIIHDPLLVQKAVRQKLEGEYTDKKGDAIESIIRIQLDLIEAKYGVTHTKGQVSLVGKEVDHVIPSISDPWVMIMTSYMETTSSSQTARANEQSEMYGTIQGKNRRYGTQHIFINFVDGAGWLARRPDLRKLHAGCDFILNLKTLNCLEAIVCKNIPEKYFTVQPRPEVEG